MGGCRHFGVRLSVPVVADGTIVVGTAQGKLIAIDERSGETLWVSIDPFDGGLDQVTLGVFDDVCTFVLNDVVYGVDTSTGRMRFALPADLRDVSVFILGHVVYVLGLDQSSKERLCGYDLLSAGPDRSRRWGRLFDRTLREDRPVPGTRLNVPMVSDGTRIYLGGQWGDLYSCDALGNVSPVWSNEAGLALFPQIAADSGSLWFVGWNAARRPVLGRVLIGGNPQQRINEVDATISPAAFAVSNDSIWLGAGNSVLGFSTVALGGEHQAFPLPKAVTLTRFSVCEAAGERHLIRQTQQGNLVTVRSTSLSTGNDVILWQGHRGGSPVVVCSDCNVIVAEQAVGAIHAVPLAAGISGGSVGPARAATE